MKFEVIHFTETNEIKSKASKQYVKTREIKWYD